MRPGCCWPCARPGPARHVSTPLTAPGRGQCTGRARSRQVAARVEGTVMCRPAGPRVERPAFDRRPRYEVDRGTTVGGVGPEPSSALTTVSVGAVVGPTVGVDAAFGVAEALAPSSPKRALQLICEPDSAPPPSSPGPRNRSSATTPRATGTPPLAAPTP